MCPPIYRLCSGERWNGSMEWRRQTSELGSLLDWQCTNSLIRLASVCNICCAVQDQDTACLYYCRMGKQLIGIFPEMRGCLIIRGVDCPATSCSSFFPQASEQLRPIQLTSLSVPYPWRQTLHQREFIVYTVLHGKE